MYIAAAVSADLRQEGKCLRYNCPGSRTVYVMVEYRDSLQQSAKVPLLLNSRHSHYQFVHLQCDNGETRQGAYVRHRVTKSTNSRSLLLNALARSLEFGLFARHAVWPLESVPKINSQLINE